MVRPVRPGHLQHHRPHRGVHKWHDARGRRHGLRVAGCELWAWLASGCCFGGCCEHAWSLSGKRPTGAQRVLTLAHADQRLCVVLLRRPDGIQAAGEGPAIRGLISHVCVFSLITVFVLCTPDISLCLVWACPAFFLSILCSTWNCCAHLFRQWLLTFAPVRVGLN